MPGVGLGLACRGVRCAVGGVANALLSVWQQRLAAAAVRDGWACEAGVCACARRGGRGAGGEGACSIARLRISSFSGLLWQAWQLQPKQYWPEAKHSQYSFRQRELRQLHDLRSLASLS